MSSKIYVNIMSIWNVKVLLEFGRIWTINSRGHVENNVANQLKTFGNEYLKTNRRFLEAHLNKPCTKSGEDYPSKKFKDRKSLLYWGQYIQTYIKN